MPTRTRTRPKREGPGRPPAPDRYRRKNVCIDLDKQSIWLLKRLALEMNTSQGRALDDIIRIACAEG